MKKNEMKNSTEDLNKNEMEEMKMKHYNRLKGLMTYDIEERSNAEKMIILEQLERVAKDMMKELNQE